MPTSSISSFKRFLLRFIIPTFIIVGGFAVLFDLFFDRKIILNTQSSGAYKIYRNINIKNELEIPIFGSSRASGSYIPDVIDSNCFNYGIEKTQFNLLELFLKKELAQNKTTPIIINLDYEIWADWIGDHANYIPNLNDKDVQDYFKKEDKWYYHVTGMRYYGFYQHYFKNYIANGSQKNYLNKGGFFLLNKSSPEDLNNEIELRKNTPFVYTPNAEKETRFINLMSINIKRKIFVVIAPYHSSYIRTLKGRNSANRFLEEIKKHSNFAVLDYSDAAYPDSMFINTTHLNYIGANRFSRQLKTEFNKYTPEYFK
jgi:hypothetical protein